MAVPDALSAGLSLWPLIGHSVRWSVAGRPTILSKYPEPHHRDGHTHWRVRERERGGGERDTDTHTLEVETVTVLTVCKELGTLL